MSWASTRVRYVAELNPTAAAWVTSQPELEASFLPMEAIGENASLRLDQTRPVKAVRNGYSFFQDGDVAFAKVTPCFENGKAAVMSGLAEGIGFGTTELTVARANSRIHNRFLFYVLTEHRFRQLGKSAMTGAGGLKRVPDHFVKDFSFPLPSLAEQRQVVDFLDRETAQIDGLIGKQERLIELLAERAQAIVTAYVANEVQPGPEDSGLRLKHIYSIVDERAKGADLPLMSVSIHRGVQRRDETTDDEPRADDLSNYKVCRAGDIVLNRMRAFQGALGSSSEAGLVSPDYLVIRPHQWIEPGWLEMVLRSKWAISEMQSRLRGIGSIDQGVIRTPRINAVDLGEIRICVPTIGVQRESLEEIHAVRKRISLLSSKCTTAVGLLRERRSALISAAVTGKISVTNEGVAA